MTRKYMGGKKDRFSYPCRQGIPQTFSTQYAAFVLPNLQKNMMIRWHLKNLRDEMDEMKIFFTESIRR